MNPTSISTNNLNIAYINIHGQSGLSLAKQYQIQDFLVRNSIDILHCQEINIEEDSFSKCNYIVSNYNIIPNNSHNRYGTATMVRSDFNVENVKMDTEGRAILFSVEKMTFGNIYI